MHKCAHISKNNPYTAFFTRYSVCMRNTSAWLCLTVLTYGCSSSTSANACGAGGTAVNASDSQGVAVYCGYGIVVGGFRPCPETAPFRIERSDAQGRPVQICSNRSADELPSNVCIQLGLSCGLGDVGFSDAGADAAVLRGCPAEVPGVEAICTDYRPGLACDYACDDGGRAQAACTNGNWSTAQTGARTGCRLQNSGVCCPIGSRAQLVAPGALIGGWAPSLAQCQPNTTTEGCFNSDVDDHSCPLLRTGTGASCAPWNRTCPSTFPTIDGICTETNPLNTVCDYECDGAVQARATCDVLGHGEGRWRDATPGARNNCRLVASRRRCGTEGQVCESDQTCVRFAATCPTSNWQFTCLRVQESACSGAANDCPICTQWPGQAGGRRFDANNITCSCR